MRFRFAVVAFLQHPNRPRPPPRWVPSVNRSLEKKVTAGFGVAALVLLLVAGAAAWNATRFDETFERVDHTHAVLSDLEQLLIGVIGLQSSVRGFILTGDEDLLASIRSQGDAIDRTLLQLRAGTTDNSLQQRRLDRLEPMIAHSREIMWGRIAARRARGLAAAQEAFAPLSGQQTVDQIRWAVLEMEKEERRLLAERISRTRTAARATLEAVIFGGLMAVAFITASGFLVHRDLRHRLHAEQALRRSQQMFQRLFDNSPDAFLLVDRTGIIVRANRKAETLFGWEPDELVGCPVDTLLPAPAQARHGAHLAAYFAAPRARPMGAGLELFGRRKDNRSFAVDIMLSPFESDEDLQALAIVRDISERRANEERIRQLNLNLQLQNARLEAANKELESFSYSVSHDLRAPLRHIDGFASLLANHAGATLDEKSHRFLTVISDSARRMGRLIDDLLTFSRMGRAQIELAEIDHDLLVAGVQREGGFDRREGIGWHIAPLPRVHADPAMLRQVWLNLLDNAVKYSAHATPPRIEIGHRPDLGEPGEHVFYIRDNGVGFDMKYAAKLFGVFQRLHSESEFEGTGIGLANVRRIVTRHGGRTWAESAPSGGATFFFSLPARSAPPAPVPSAASPAPGLLP